MATFTARSSVLLLSSALLLALAVAGQAQGTRSPAPAQTLNNQQCVAKLDAFSDRLVPQKGLVPPGGATTKCSRPSGEPAGTCGPLKTAGNKLWESNFNTLSQASPNKPSTSRLNALHGLTEPQRTCMRDDFGETVDLVQTYFSTNINRVGSQGVQGLTPAGANAPYGSFVASIPNNQGKPAVYTINQNIFLTSSQDLNDPKKLPELTDNTDLTKFANNQYVQHQAAVFHGMNKAWQWWNYAGKNRLQNADQYWQAYCDNDCRFADNPREYQPYQYTNDNFAKYLCCLRDSA